MDIASLGIKIDSSDAPKAAKSLDQFTASAEQADRSAAKLSKGTRETSKGLASVERPANTAAQALGRYSAVLSRVGVAGGVAGGLAVVAAALTHNTLAAIRTGEELEKAARLSGLAAGEFSTLASAGRRAGVDVGTLGKALGDLRESISAAAAGGSRNAAAQALQQIGLSAQFLRTINPQEQLRQIADGLARLPDSADRVRIGNVLLAGSYNELIPIIGEGANGIRRLIDEQNRLGGALTTEQIKKLAEAREAVRHLTSAWQDFKTMLGAEIAPALTTVLTKLQQIRSSEESLDSLKARYRSIADGYNEVAKAQLQAQIKTAEAARFTNGSRRTGGGSKPALDPALVAEFTRELGEGDKKADQLARSLSRASLSFDISAIRQNLQVALGEFSNFESVLNAQHNARLISDKQFYEEKRRFVEETSKASIAALEAENARLSSQRQSGPELLATQEKIAENETRITELRQKAAAELQILGIEEQQSLRDVESAFDDAREAAQSYLDTLNRRRALELSGMGRGERQREIDRGRSDIDEDYERQRQQLERDRRRGQLGEGQYERELQVLEEFHRKALADYDAYWDALTEKQGSFYVGASEALRNYVDESANVAKQVEGVFSRAFNSMEDALTQFVMTGKLDFKSLADSIIADLVRIQIRTLLTQVFSGVLGGSLGGLFGGGSSTGRIDNLSGNWSGPRFASGGNPLVGRAALVGEKGPELIIPRSPVTVIPNHALGGGVVINQTLVPSPDMPVAQFEAVMQRFKAEARAEVYADMRRDRWRRVTG